MQIQQENVLRFDPRPQPKGLSGMTVRDLLKSIPTYTNYCEIIWRQGRAVPCLRTPSKECHIPRSGLLGRNPTSEVSRGQLNLPETWRPGDVPLAIWQQHDLAEHSTFA